MTDADAGTALEDIVVRDTAVSSAVDEPMRAMILDTLAEAELTASQVHERLEERGIDRTENTIRHHINELRDAGLVDVVRFEEGRGGTTKYYGAKMIVLSYAIPDARAAELETLIGAVRPMVEEAIGTLRDAHAEEIDAITAEMGPCEHCTTQKYETYVLLTALRRAFVRAYRETPS